MLEEVHDLAPEIYPLIYSAYSTPSTLFWADHTILSTEGVQQGEPLGSLLFCLSLHCHCASLSSTFCVTYVDDMSVGGDVENILHDVDIIGEAEVLGLPLNNHKSEIICFHPTVRGTILCSLPGAQVIAPDKATLLRSPIGDVTSIDASIEEKIKALHLIGKRLKNMSTHDSLILLRHYFAIPRQHYLLCSAPCFLSGELERYDSILRDILSTVTNTLLDVDHPAWIQASLPI